MKDMVLRTKDLEVILRPPQKPLFWHRFCPAGAVEQVILHQKHRFCQPEQKISGRVTCGGQGLCSEFVWDELACSAAPGEFFLKPGVGLLKQRPEGGPYQMWKEYEVHPFEVSAEQTGENRAVFRQRQEDGRGILAMLTRSVKAEDNTLTITTSLENMGEAELCLMEYQHNFVALDDILVGPGYCLSIPYDKTLEDLAEKTVRLPDYQIPVQDVLEVRGQEVYWKKAMDDIACHKETEESNILRLPEYTWMLSNRQTSARVSETVHFHPQRLVIWGIEHCICAEVYAKWQVEPGECQTFARTWRFEDET